MPNGALYMFLAAMMVAVFTFLSVATWITARSQERQSRDRAALLRSIAEQPNENARLVLDHVREQEARREQRALERERKGMLQGALILIAIGIALSVMLTNMATKSGAWSVGLIPGLLGVALLASLPFTDQRSDDKTL
jgi:predicted cobalt transporter CbtA